jgi:hypothetical protein
MNESNKGPTEQGTRPLGNSEPQPTPLAKGIGPNAAAKMKEHTPAATAAVRGVARAGWRGKNSTSRSLRYVSRHFVENSEVWLYQNL